MFSETFVTMYLYKRDSNTSERTCLLIHNYLKEKNFWIQNCDEERNQKNSHFPIMR